MQLKTYFLSDLHLGHSNNILNWRKDFSSVEEMENVIVDNINSLVRPKDTLILPGDVVITRRGFEAFDRILCENITIIMGNHCCERDGITFRDWVNRVKHLVSSREISLKKQPSVITHIPIHMDNGDRWLYNIHGHTHDISLEDKRYLNVSCEVLRYKPITKQQLEEMIP